MKCGKRKILTHKEIVPGHYLLSYESFYSEDEIVPGQFISIKVDPLATVLRRPFSIFDIRGQELFVFYKAVGTGTCLLAEKKPGDSIDVLEVLGHGFSQSAEEDSLALAGGGIGIAPLFLLAKRLRGKGKQVSVYLGAQTADGIFWEEEFRDMGCQVCVTTDDGSRNICGNICCGLEPDCVKNNFQRIYACGPQAMCRSVVQVAGKAGIICEVSLEEMMGCGFGVCLGCAVKVKSKGNGPAYKMVCKDGPVFDANEIEWE